MPASVPLFDREAARRIEARARAAHADDDALMQRAGRAAWHALLARWPAAQRIVVLCGPGDNAGDGYLLAMHAHAAGRAVQALALLPPRSDLALRMAQAARDAGVEVRAQISLAAGAELLQRADVVVDALLGIGLSRPPDGALLAWIGAINAAARPVLALDVPSGVDGASGHVPADAVRATCTLQLLVRHLGLYTGAALDCCGELAFDALGHQATTAAETASAELLDAAALAAWLPPRALNAHKGSFGRVLCIGGNTGMGGAGLLAAEAALRVGAGRVRWITGEPMHVAAALARCPALMVTSADADTAGSDPEPDPHSVWVIGPGLGQDAWARAWLARALARTAPLVLDADALNLLAAVAHAVPAGAVLTPHPGEAARLLDASVAQVQADRVAAARELARRHQAVVVLKGAGTVIAAADAVPRILRAGNPGMAVAGMGDVLAGVIGGLLAQGLDAFSAASAGALLHAHAGDLAARAGGERGLLPQDLFAMLRRAANPHSRHDARDGHSRD